MHRIRFAGSIVLRLAEATVKWHGARNSRSIDYRSSWPDAREHRNVWDWTLLTVRRSTEKNSATAPCAGTSRIYDAVEATGSLWEEVAITVNMRQLALCSPCGAAARIITAIEMSSG